MNSTNRGFQNQSFFGRKSFLALGIVVLLPLLAIFTLLYFGIHGFRSLIASKKKPIPNPIALRYFRRESVSAL
jgi:hypothetical protein